jgi:hypothetical protein
MKERYLPLDMTMFLSIEATEPYTYYVEPI